MGDERVEVTLAVEDDTVGTRRAAVVHVVAGQDGELVPRGGGGEAEALVVVVLVGVVV